MHQSILKILYNFITWYYVIICDVTQYVFRDNEQQLDINIMGFQHRKQKENKNILSAVQQTSETHSFWNPIRFNIL